MTIEISSIKLTVENYLKTLNEIEMVLFLNRYFPVDAKKILERVTHSEHLRRYFSVFIDGLTDEEIVLIYNIIESSNFELSSDGKFLE